MSAIDEARKSVMEYMHHTGTRAEFLTGSEWQAVYLAGDGFGEVDYNFANGELEWDWSHVRDSSPAGIAAMHSKLIEVLEDRFCRACGKAIGSTSAPSRHDVCRCH